MTHPGFVPGGINLKTFKRDEHFSCFQRNE